MGKGRKIIFSASNIGSVIKFLSITVNVY